MDKAISIIEHLSHYFLRKTPIARSKNMVSESNEESQSETIRLNLFVFWSSAISIGIFGLLFVLFPELSQFWLTYIQGQANQLFGWYYMLVIVVCLGFVA